jgi:myo-inositol-1(or 4)-monophosphatase
LSPEPPSEAASAPPDASPFLLTAIDTVRRAGAIQLAAFGGHLQITKKGAIDLVTEVDVEIERMFRTLIAERYPDHDVLGEEMGSHRASASPSRHCWIFDPIDGTTNFAHGLPIFCSSLALEIDGILSVAAVFDPTRGELFTAERGRGAWLNGTRLQVSNTSDLIDALLVTGFPYSVQREADQVLGLFGAFIARARAVRRLGSAALDVCYVAAGRMDGFWEQGLGPWDVAAAALLVQEAGGRISDLSGQPFQPRSGRLVASNGRIHDAMLETIAQFQAERSRNRTH